MKKLVARLAALLLTLSAVAPATAQLLPPLGSLIVTLSSPSQGATVSGTIPVSASVSIVGTLTVSRVEFFADGSFVGSDSGAPYSVSWSTTSVGNGSHTLSAVAVDVLGVRWTSNSVTVNVSNGPPPDTTAPSVSIASPANGATVSGTVTVRASASDNVGVTGVQFRLDGTAVGQVFTVAPYEVPFDTTAVNDGTHTIAAQAVDAAGNLATSATITVTVANGAGGAARSEESAATFSGAGWTLRGAEIAAFSGGTAGSSNIAGDTASFNFTGTGVSWIGLKCSICGIATVSIDGGAAIPVDTAGTAAVGTGASSEIVFTSPTLAAGAHTLVITVTGTTSSGGSYIIVDAFDVTGGSGNGVTRIEQDNAAVSYAGTWVRDWPSEITSGGTFSDSNTAGATLTLNFTGREVRWLGYRCNECGIARVSIDGTYVGEIDTYSASPALAVVFAARELASGPHTLTIEVTGTHDPAATDSWVIVDAFDVVTP